MDDIDVAIYKGFHDFIRVFLRAEDVYLLDDNFIAPAGPYTSVKITYSDPTTPYKYQSPITTSGDAPIIYVSYMGTIMVECYGANSFGRCHSIAHHLRDSTANQKLRDAGLAYSSHSRVADTSTSIDNQTIESRASMTVQVIYVMRTPEQGDPTSCIETVTFDDPTFTTC